MKEFDDNQTKSWRKLTAAETAQLRAWLEEHPELQADWETETRLTEALARLPDAPVPSNFTARVLRAIEREAATARPGRTPLPWFLRALVPRAAAAGVIFAAVFLTYHEHTITRRAELVQGVKVVAGVSSLPSPEILQDFDTIRQMSSAPGPDTELIALMK